MKRVIGGGLGLLMAIGLFSTTAMAQCGAPTCGVTTTCGQPNCPGAVRTPKLSRCGLPAGTCSTCMGQNQGIACNRGNFCGQNTCKSDCGVKIPECLSLGGPNVKVKGGKVYAWQGFPGDCDTPSQSCIVLEKLAPATVCLEDPISYEIQITNRGKSTVSQVQITDVVPAGFTIDKVTPEVPVVDGKLVFNIGDLAAKSAQTFTITGRASATGCLVFAGEAQLLVKFPIALPVTVIQCALAVAVTTPECVDLCDCFETIICVKNPGTAVSTNNCVTVQLPQGLADGKGESNFSWSIPSLRPGEAKTFTLKNLKASATGTYNITAVATNGRGLTAAGSDTVKIRQPMLGISKRATEKVYLGKPVTYEITVTNLGDCPAKDVTVCDAFEADSAAIKLGAIDPKPNLARNGKSLNWNFGTLQPGECRVIKYGVTALELGTIKNTAVVSAYCADPRSAPAMTCVDGVAGIVACITDDRDPIEIGETVTYTIEAKNQGMIANTNVVYVVTLDDGMEFVSAKGPKGVEFKADGKTITFTGLPSLNRGQIARWQVTVKATNAGDKRFKTTLMTDQFQKDRPVISEESTTFYDSKMVTTICEPGVPVLPAPTAAQ